MKWVKYLVFALGIAALAALTYYAGTTAVIAALRALGLGGLLAIALLHLPILALMGVAWWLVNSERSDLPHFLWARIVRDAAAEVLPFSQLGGYVLGVRALHLNGVHAARGALSMGVDLVVELCAKLPYVFAGLLALMMLAPGSRFIQALAAALALTLAIAVLAVVLRGRVTGLLETATLRIAGRWPNFGAALRDETASFFRTVFTKPGPLWSAFVAHVACWFLGAGEAWITLRFMGTHITLVEAVALDSLMSGLRTFAFLVPAAAGVQEASYVLVGAAFGLPASVAIALSLARRARELMLGVPTLAIWQALEAGAPAKAPSA